MLTTYTHNAGVSMANEIVRHIDAAGEIISLNIDDLDIAELERRLELAVMKPSPCLIFQDCNCPALASCGTFCQV